jgi:hypothetical protein
VQRAASDYDSIGGQEEVYQEVVSFDDNYDIINPDHVALPLPPPRGISVNSAVSSDSVVSLSRLVSVVEDGGDSTRLVTQPTTR